MMIAGIVLSCIGIATAPAGAVLAGFGNSRPFSDDTFVASLVIGLGATLLPAVGIPLWVNGAKPLEPWEKAAVPSWAIPSVAASPRSTALRWAF